MFYLLLILIVVDTLYILVFSVSWNCFPNSCSNFTISMLLSLNSGSATSHCLICLKIAVFDKSLVKRIIPSNLIVEDLESPSYYVNDSNFESFSFVVLNLSVLISIFFTYFSSIFDFSVAKQYNVRFGDFIVLMFNIFSICIQIGSAISLSRVEWRNFMRKDHIIAPKLHPQEDLSAFYENPQEELSNFDDIESNTHEMSIQKPISFYLEVPKLDIAMVKGSSDDNNPYSRTTNAHRKDYSISERTISTTVSPFHQPAISPKKSSLPKNTAFQLQLSHSSTSKRWRLMIYSLYPLFMIVVAIVSFIPAILSILINQFLIWPDLRIDSEGNPTTFMAIIQFLIYIRLPLHLVLIEFPALSCFAEARRKHGGFFAEEQLSLSSPRA
ncbi:hypothetical protein ADUPG1_013678 [Aduncisulcus paluster]|uniref:G protein-coupled receptor n=1 Tax=Aduncisulcus paluster TaxID=2918883 RepID=A0ABQ5K3T2_9EUKA|nr:hypothetical protein ADUPG1_013678 [Aduncisulcus paluster]